MAKSKLYLSQPRKSKKLRMKKIALMRGKAIGKNSQNVPKLQSVGTNENQISTETILDFEGQLVVSNHTDCREQMMDEFINSKSSCYIDSDISNAGSVRDCSDNEISGDDSEDRSLVYEQSDMDISEDTDLEELCYEKATANSSLFKTSGRRIVNISYLFSQLKSLKHEGKCVKRKKFATTDRSYGPEASNIIADMDLHKKV
ncbi:hypothetical protein PPYR_02140 [Photinus pyralis]|uniref:Uncharacterized protein n=1 Tax=Photinus pyralis TaxID=7054 RepID=A0A5N4B737_PHOPY|nr:hypothetical protein PPYR_15744 [Photinus pyralis]KAB0805170.1 hypothetical protein PPYR_02140 [Photinus pyralis]